MKNKILKKDTYNEIGLLLVKGVNAENSSVSTALTASNPLFGFQDITPPLTSLPDKRMQLLLTNAQAAACLFSVRLLLILSISKYSYQLPVTSYQLPVTSYQSIISLFTVKSTHSVKSPNRQIVIIMDVYNEKL